MNDKIVFNGRTQKVLSIVFAALLWFFVITEQNPDITKEFVIPVKLINMSYLERNNMVLMDDPATFKITLKIKDKKNTLDKLNYTVLRAVADLTGHKTPGENAVNVIIEGIPQGMSPISVSSSFVKVRLEPKIKIQRTIEAKISGAPLTGFATMSSTQIPNDVLITGPESQINKIVTVKADVDITDVNSDVKRILPIRVLDEQGRDVTGIQLEPSNVEIRIPVSPTKKVPIKLNVVGKPAGGFKENGIAVFPREVQIVGRRDLLANIDRIEAELINIEGITVDMDTEISLQLPEGIELVNKHERFRVFIDVEKIAVKELEIANIDIVNMDQELEIDTMQDKLRVAVRGSETDLADINNNIRFYVDLGNAKEGSNVVNVMWQKPNDIEIIDLTPTQMEIVLKKKQ